MIQFVGLLGLVAFVAASLVVGGRILLLAARTRQLPETSVGLSLFLSGGIGTALVILPLLRPGLDPDSLYLIHQTGSATNHFGWVCLFVFVWQVFRPTERWAAGLFFVSTGVLLLGGAGLAVNLEPGGGLAGGSAPPDLWFWMSLGARLVVYLWATFESFRYYGMLKRRLALGLSDRNIVDRFFYWGVCTGAVVLIWINLGVRSVLLDVELAQAISFVVSALLGFVVAGSLSFAFFPGKTQTSDSQSSAAEISHP